MIALNVQHNLDITKEVILMDNTNTTAQLPEIPAEIRSYLEGILADANMQALDDDLKEEMIKELYVRLDNYITSVLVDNLPEEHMDEFVKLNDSLKDKAEIEAFLKEKIPNVEKVFTDAFIAFRDLYLGGVGAYRNAPSKVDGDTAAATPPAPLTPAPVAENTEKGAEDTTQVN